MIPLDSFTAHSADGRLVPVVPGGHNIPLTFGNRNEYVERTLDYRLHEMDRQVSWFPHSLETCFFHCLPENSEGMKPKVRATQPCSWSPTVLWVFIPTLKQHTSFNG